MEAQVKDLAGNVIKSDKKKEPSKRTKELSEPKFKLPVSEIWDQCFGRWREIIAHYTGITSGQMPLCVNCPCPVCGGKDRFYFKDRGNGQWYCNNCHGRKGHEGHYGDSLLMALKGWDFETFRLKMEDYLMTTERPAETVIEKATTSDSLIVARRLVKESKHFKGTLAETYLKDHRHLHTESLWDCKDLRFLSATSIPKAMVGDDGRRNFPALGAVTRDYLGKGAGLHVTVLNDDGSIREGKNRYVLGSPGYGVVIRHDKDNHPEHLVVGEGIENVLSMMELTGYHQGVIALNANCLAKFFPAHLGKLELLVIAGDNDTGFVGQLSAYKLAHDVANKLGDQIGIKTEIPERAGDDWNDVLRDMKATTGSICPRV